MQIISKYLIYFLIGAIMMLGVRAVEWVVPGPEIMLLVCVLDQYGETEDCEYLDSYFQEQSND